MYVCLFFNTGFYINYNYIVRTGDDDDEPNLYTSKWGRFGSRTGTGNRYHTHTHTHTHPDRYNGLYVDKSPLALFSGTI